MKSIYNNQIIKFLFIGLTMTCVVALGVFVQSCSNEFDDEMAVSNLLDDAILNSSELEEFIIAGAEYNRSLADFTNGLSRIDFSTLEVTYSEDGRKVVHLPATFAEATKFDEKERSLYERKDAFRKKFPQFSSFSEDMGKKYFHQCVQKSVNVTSKLLELGIKTTLPKLKNGIEIDYNEDFSYIMWQLYNWMNNANYVEVYIIGYADGTYEVVQMPGATQYNGGELNIQYSQTPDGDSIMYYPSGSKEYSSNVISMGHTHRQSHVPTESYFDADSVYHQADMFYVPPGVSRYIYYQQDIYPY